MGGQSKLFGFHGGMVNGIDQRPHLYAHSRSAWCKGCLDTCPAFHYSLYVIDEHSIRHKGVRDLYRTGRSRRVSQDLVERILEGMSLLDAAQSLEELRPFQDMALHQLKGKRRGTWAISVNGPWRLTFKFRNETVFDLNLEQYH